MKKNIFISILAALILFAVKSQAQEVQNTGNADIQWISWDEMVKKQSEEPKKVFIDLYTDWCGWCKRMDQSTFIDPVVVDYMNRNYYAVKMDAEMSKEIVWNGVTFVNPAPNQKRSTHQFAASLLDNQLSYPSFVVLDENFNRINIIKGFQQPEPLLGNLLFFATNQHVRYNQYIDQQRQLQQQRAAQQPQQN